MRTRPGTPSPTRRLSSLAAFLGLFLVGWTACSSPREQVVVCHAGSLSPLISELGTRFEKNNPSVQVLSEPGGSLDVVRRFLELDRPCDLVATADYRLIEDFLKPDSIRESYYLLGNEMVLATSRGELFQEASRTDWQDHWIDYLSQYSFGISDPDRDPAGYYAHLVWKLAEIHYDRQGAYQRFVRQLKPNWTRPRSSELIALLESGHLDFAFIYRSSAIQTGLSFLALPPQVSLGDEAYHDLYGQVFVRVQGANPDEQIEITGAPIRYGIGISMEAGTSSENFLRYALGEEGQQLQRALGYTPIANEKISAARLP